MNKLLNILKKYKTLFILTCILLVSSCAVYCCSPASYMRPESIASSLPRQSFVKLEKKIHIRTCPEDPQKLEQCVDRKMGSSASGFVFKRDDEGAYVVTAAHVCEDSGLKAFLRSTPGTEIVSKLFHVISIDNERYNFITLKYDMSIDVCVGYVYSLAKPAVSISRVRPRPGDVVYNLAAPIGIFNENAIPIMDGYYIGVSNGVAQYSVPAAGGSSGSPLFNSRGELIGLIHSVYVRFPFITLSPTYSQLIGFINVHSNKDNSFSEKALQKYLGF